MNTNIPYQIQTGYSFARSGLSCLLSGLLLLLVVFQTSLASGFGDNLIFHGFASQGYFYSTENNYPVLHSKNGNAEFNEVALNVHSLPTERIRIGIQLLARDLGDDGNNAVYVDWAYGDFRWRDYLGFKFGKVKFPHGLYNYSRDIDMARTHILLPESVYTDNWRDFTLAMEGMSLYGNSYFSQLGEFEYEFFGGSLNIPNPNSAYWIDSYTAYNYGTLSWFGARDSDSTTTVEYISDEIRGESIRMPWVYGGGLFWNTPIPGLKVSATAFAGRYEINHRGSFVRVATPTDTTQQRTTNYGFLISGWHSYYEAKTFSAEYTLSNLTIAGEYSSFYQETDNNTVGGYYGQITYQLNKRFSASTYYSEYYNNLFDKDGSDLDDSGLNDYFRWQKELCISGRCDISDNWLFKLEIHDINGAALVKRIHNEGSFENPDVIEKDWMLLVAKTTFHF